MEHSSSRLSKLNQGKLASKNSSNAQLHEVTPNFFAPRYHSSLRDKSNLDLKSENI